MKINRFLIAAPLLAVLFSCSPGVPETALAPPAVAGLPEVHSFLEGEVSEGRLPGAVGLVARGNEILSLEAVGMADREAGRTMEADTLFRIASMTKPITSVAVMILFEEGRFGLDDPVSKVIPELASPEVLRGDGSRETVPASSEITIRQLLTHTSGITYRFAGIDPLPELYAEAGVSDGLVETEGTIAEGVRRLAALPLLHQPGERWTYGLSTDVLGYLVEVVSGRSLEEFLRTRIFEPLGMKDTRFFLSEEESKRLAAVYAWSEPEGLRRLGEEPIQEGPLVYSTTFHYRGPRTYFSGGAGLVSTARDYFRFALMLRNEGELDSVRILRPETVRLMTTNQIANLDHLQDLDLPEDMRFGLGFSVKGAQDDTGGKGTFGWAGFFHTLFWVDPENDVIGVFLSQLRLPEGKSVATEFNRVVYRALEGKLPTSRSAPPS